MLSAGFWRAKIRLSNIMDIKKIILPVALVVVLGGFIIYKQLFSAPAPATPTTNTDNQTSAANTSQNSTSNASSGQTGLKDGSYTGDVANTVFGDVQVSVVISGGKITDVQKVKMPDSPGHTSQVSASSFPVLRSEAIQAQSASVNVVSGATQTSEGFSQSLASALSKAS